MKARTLVFMLCIGLMCLTGFGSTTADLTDNPKAEIVQLDDAVSVVSVEVESFQVIDLEQDFSSISYEKSISGSPDLLMVDQLINSQPELTDPFTPEGDVGWRFNQENYNLSHTVSLHRNPRDGIRYDFTKSTRSEV